MGVSRARLLAIEEAAVRSWPALQRMPIDGWLWRCTSGGSVRANTVATLAFSGADVEGAIDKAERLYRTAGAPPRFTISEVSTPSDLDQRLAARCYQRGDDHVTMAKSVSASIALPDVVALGAEPTSDWMAVYLSGLTEDRRGVRRAYWRACRRIACTSRAYGREGRSAAGCRSQTASSRRSSAWRRYKARSARAAPALFWRPSRGGRRRKAAPCSIFKPTLTTMRQWLYTSAAASILRGGITRVC
jgi:hypothetical protein